MRTTVWAIVTTGMAVSATALGGSACAPEWDITLGNPGASGSVSALGTWNGELFVGGSFAQFGSVAGTMGMARVVNGVVMPIGGGATDGFVNDFIVFDDGNGADVYIGGAFSSVSGGMAGTRGLVRWTGTALEAVPGLPFASGITSSVWAMTKMGNTLVAGGTGEGVGAEQKPSLVFWDGTTWTSVGDQFTGQVAPVILCMTTWDQGMGPVLYFGGRFGTFDPDPNDPNNPIVTCTNIMGFDGTTWFPLDTGLTRSTSIISQVQALKVYNDGNGERLYAGGRFDRGSGNVTSAVAKWDGVSWQPVGAGFPMPTEVRAFEVWNDGSGTSLYAAGNFQASGAATVRRFARWTGTEWVEVGGGVSDAVTRMVQFEVGGRPAVVLGGSFLDAGNGTGGGAANRVAAWVGCDASCPGDANGDMIVNFADLNIVLSNFGLSGAGIPGDVTGDGQVNFADLNVVLSFFGTSC
ncbi:MAG: hypothetical protein AB7G17_06400 [Phycisphaerales bacterium]